MVGVLNIRDFMRRVVPWPETAGAPGYVNLHWTKPDPKYNGVMGRPFKDVDDFLSTVQFANGKPSWYKDIYYCLSSQLNTGKVYNGRATAMRNKPNALALRSVWLDIDVKDDGYKTLPEAIDALTAFTAAAKLPPPTALVASGGGLHVYWINNQPLTVQQWQPYAEGMKALAITHGLKCDAGLTTDSARILRVPGTFNKKKEPYRPVRLILLQPADYDFTTALVAVHSVGVTAPVTSAADPFDLSQFPVQPHVADMESLSAGIKSYDDTPLNWDEMFVKCPYFQDAVLTGGKDHSQGLWMLSVLICTFIEGGRHMATRVSRGYPKYDKTGAELDAMWDRKLADRQAGIGWPACSKIEAEGCKHCATCPLKGTIRSPLNTITNKATVKLTAPLPSGVSANDPFDLRLPGNYYVNEEGFITEHAVVPDLKGGERDARMPLFGSLLREAYTFHNPRALYFRTSLDMERTDWVCIPDELCATDTELLKALWRQGVKVNTQFERRVRHFMSSWVTKLDRELARLERIPYGWVGEPSVAAGFAYGGKTFYADGRIMPSGFDDNALRQSYTPVGNPDVWMDAHRMLIAEKAPELEVIVAVAFGSPLLHIAGEKAGTWSPWTNLSGAHKSTACRQGAAVWGNPALTKENPATSEKYLAKKMGDLKNLPVYLDEVSDAEKMNAVRKQLNAITEAFNGGKLKSNRDYFTKTNWSTMVVVCSNCGIRDSIEKYVKSTDATHKRVLEYICPVRNVTEEAEADAGRLIDKLDYHYGHMGLRYAQLIGSQPEAVVAVGKEIMDRFMARVGARQSERFWTAMCTAVLTGATLANKIGCEFHLEAMEDFLVNVFKENREYVASLETVGGSALNTSDILTDFLKSVSDNVLWTETLLPAGRPSASGKTAVWVAGVNANRPRPVHVHCAINDRVIRISRNALVAFLDQHKATGGITMKGLRDHFKATESRGDLTTGMPLTGGKERILVIPVPFGSPLEDLLYAHTGPADRPQGPGHVPTDASGIDTGIKTVTDPVTSLAIGVIRSQQDLDAVEKMEKNQ